MKKANRQTIQSALTLMKACPACATKYTNESVNVISTGERGALVSMACPGCKLAILIMITSMPFGLVGTGLPTDCMPQEIERFMQTGEVTVDDVLEVHTLLEKS